MPCFSGEAVNNQILFQCHVMAPKAAGISADFLNSPSFTALLDTGAQTTCITSNVVDSLGVGPCSWATINGVGGAQTCPQYLVDLVIPVLQQVPTRIEGQKENLTFGRGFINTKVNLLHGEHWEFDVLLGMDIILQTHFSIHGQGAFTICV